AAVIGVISVVRRTPYHWQRSDIEFVSALATHATVAIQNAELFDKAEIRAAQMRVLQAASARMNRQNSIESVGQAIVEETRRIIDYHNARVYVLEPPYDLVPIAFAGTVGAYEKVDMALLRTRLGRGFTGWAAEHGEPLLIHNANLDPRGSTIPGTDDVDESMLVVPVRYDERVTGAITLSKLGLDQFTEEDLRLLTILADQAATALESARLLGRTQGLADELQRLVDMSGELAHSLDPREVADLIAHHLAGALGVDQCAISYWDRTEGKILTWGFYPTERPVDLRPDYALANFPETRRVLEEQATMIIDVDDPGADEHEVRLLRANGDHVVLMLPLVAKGESIGVVELISRSPLHLDDARIELIRTMANEAAMALENAHLYEEARRLADRDQLTGFYNHRYLHERLGEETVRAQRSRTPLSLLMIDLDDFKLVNDTFGHLFGDRVLVWTAEIIRSSLRASDLPARYGGDEFAVILPDTDATAAEAVARRMLDAFRERPYESDSRGPVSVAASIGIATFLRDGRSGQDLIAAADASLYRVKHAGGHGAEATPDADGIPDVA
ncbi:MAG TPA: diguanylate cyclase, partial [Candidatus Acidoferrum sp.]|nr:diguanylate cyclase [Candidatus Acidoferrum sp.]